METRLSSRGQTVIPKAVRESLGLRTGTQFRVHVDKGKIILEPVTVSPIDVLYGKYAGADFLTELEKEHRQELVNEEPICT